MRALGIVLVAAAAAVWLVGLWVKWFAYQDFPMDIKLDCIWIAVVGLFLVSIAARK